MANVPRKARMYLVGVLAASGLTAGQVTSAVELVTLRGQVIDKASGEPLAARVYIRSATGEWYFPKSDSPEGSAIEYRRERSAESVEMHATVSAHPFTAALPPGDYTVTVERGKEYLPREDRLVVGADGAELSVELSRWIDMSQRGWYSGDTHVHRPVSEMANVVLAEDLNLAFPLTYWVTASHASPLAANKAKVEGASPEPIVVDATHLVYPVNTEYEIFSVQGRQHTLGAVLILGHRQPFDGGVPPVGELARRAHAQGALLDLEKHSWPWSLMLPPVMDVDLFELANNHVWRTRFGFPRWTIEAAGAYMHLEMDDQGFTEWGWIDFGFQTYYALLNCGYRLRPTAGTAAGVHPVPTGFGRVYVHLPDGLTYESWMQGLDAGRSFVTTGPMLPLTFNGQDPGYRFESAEGDLACHVGGAAESAVELDRLEIVVNGRIARTVTPANEPTGAGGFRSAIDETLPLTGTSWVAVRAFERRADGRVRFAHTAPAFYDVPGAPLAPRREEVQYFIGRMEEELDRNRDVLEPDALAEYQRALEAYRALLERAR